VRTEIKFHGNTLSLTGTVWQKFIIPGGGLVVVNCAAFGGSQYRCLIVRSWLLPDLLSLVVGKRIRSI
jgi:hypothetical protein